MLFRSRFLDGAQEDDFWISVFVMCELCAGAELSQHPREERRRVDRLCAGLHVVHPDDGFPAMYSRLLAWQSRHQGRIATMDLLIATSAIVAGAGLVTRNVKDFSRVPGLDVLQY